MRQKKNKKNLLPQRVERLVAGTQLLLELR
jgi:hypothetical protein